MANKLGSNFKFVYIYPDKKTIRLQQIKEDIEHIKDIIRVTQEKK